MFSCAEREREKKRRIFVCNMELKYGGVMDELSCYYDCVKKEKMKNSNRIVLWKSIFGNKFLVM